MNKTKDGPKMAIPAMRNGVHGSPIEYMAKTITAAVAKASVAILNFIGVPCVSRV
jgi:hypothetical protein